MRYRLLGNSGLRVSEMCLGTMTFGEDWGWGTGKDGSRNIYNTFRDAGGNFVDTANFYTNGTSESWLGEFMQGHRETIVLATKYTNAPPGNDANAAGNHRKSMMQAVEASLRRLKTDYVDLYWLHIWDEITPVDEVLRGFDDLVRQGKILYAGVSDAPAWWISRANTFAELRGWTRFVGLQVEYNLLERTVERELLPMAKSLNIGVTAWSPLASGWLSGKYAAGTKAGGRLDEEQMRQLAIRIDDRTNAIVQEVMTIGDEIRCSPAQVALAWLRRRATPIIPIIGARKVEQLKDNLASLNVKLSADQLARLNEISKIDLGFPNNFFDRDMVRTFAFGGMKDAIDVA